MDINRYFVVPVLVGFIFMNGLAPASDREGGLAPLLDKISKRMNSYPENGNWKYSVVTKTTEMDKQWRPKKTTITTANVKEVDNVLSGEILKAVETEDGITKDVTEKIAKQTKKQLERTNKERAEEMNMTHFSLLMRTREPSLHFTDLMTPTLMKGLFI
jgi:seryl-tRNA synthetase